jgi:hypothetical protein
MTPGEWLQLGLSVVAPSSVLAWAYTRWSHRLRVRRITDPNDRDLERAFELYRRRIPAYGVRDSTDDIIRWLREIREEHARGDFTLIQYLLVAMKGRCVDGFFYADYYPRTGLLLVAYLAANDETVDGRERATRAIGRFLKRALRRSLRDCRGIVFELEQPTPDTRDDWLARFRTFQRLARPFGITIKRLAVPYVQPRLSIWDDAYDELPQYLFYARTRPPPLGDTVPKQEVEKVLDTLYNVWYASSYEDEPERDTEYRAYLRRVFTRISSSLPAEVSTYSWPLRFPGRGLTSA